MASRSRAPDLSFPHPLVMFASPWNPGPVALSACDRFVTGYSLLSPLGKEIVENPPGICRTLNYT